MKPGAADESMRVVAVTIAYVGTGLAGWQRQRTQTSVQSLLEDALGRLEGVKVTVTGAGRTDAGVHALGQVASVRLQRCRLSGVALQRALNATLPAAVRVLRIDDAAADFHARYRARAKRYTYRLVNQPVLSPFEAGFAWHVPAALDLEAMRRAAALVVGSHDFAAFQAAGSSVTTTVRTMHAVALDEGPGRAPGARVLTVTVSGDGFLRHMVRILVGTLVDIGRGRWPPEEMAAILTSTGPYTRRPHRSCPRAVPGWGGILKNMRSALGSWGSCQRFSRDRPLGSRRPRAASLAHPPRPR